MSFKNTYIKNDYGELRDLYWSALNQIKKQPYHADEYKWPWIYCTDEGLMQHAPARKYISGKMELKANDLN